MHASRIRFWHLVLHFPLKYGTKFAAAKNIVDTHIWLQKDWKKTGWTPFCHTDKICAISDLTEYAGTEVSLVTVEKLILCQHEDLEGQSIFEDISTGILIPYSEYVRGILLRISRVDRAFQILVLVSLMPRILPLAHHTLVAGHPVINHRYCTIRSTFYWTSIMVELRRVAFGCHAWSRERTQLRTHQAPMKLFLERNPWNLCPRIYLDPSVAPPSNTRLSLWLQTVSPNYSGRYNLFR